jgi:NAD(P)-dependent dehydrogenase (short-subunit alcohol dehydrogenase family)
VIGLDRKVVLVTGAGSGIGAAAARLFTEAGASVAGLDIGPCTAQLALRGDASSAADMERAVADVEQHFGRLDVLVSNAGLFLAGRGDGPSPTLSEEVWHRTLDVNLKSVYLGARFGIPAMRRSGGGAIVNVASVAALRVGAGASDAYTAAKGGVLALTRTLAVAHAPAVRVNAVVPGPIDTPMLDAAGESARRLRELVPLGRLGRPEEVAWMILFLSSEAASYCTGQFYVVDGGYTAN